MSIETIGIDSALEYYVLFVLKFPEDSRMFRSRDQSTSVKQMLYRLRNANYGQWDEEEKVNPGYAFRWCTLYREGVVNASYRKVLDIS